MASINSDRNILNGQHLLIGSIFPIDCVCYSTNNDKPTSFDQLNSGIDYYLIEFLAQHYNYTYDVINGGYKFGAVVNGSIDGVCGMVNRSEVDIGIGLLAATYFRRPFVDFTLPYMQQTVTFMIATKFATHDQSFDISNTDYWFMGILLTIAFFISVIYGFVSKRKIPDSRSKYNPFWTLYQCFVQQPNDEEPTNSNLRIMFILWFFVGLITVTSVAGELVSMLAGQPPSFIGTIDELADATNIQIYSTSTPVQTELKTSPDENLQKLNQRLTQESNHYSHGKTIEFIRNDMMKKPIAYIMNKLELACHRKKINEQGLYIPPTTHENTFYTIDVGIAIAKQSKMTPYFNFAIRRLQEIGEFDYLKWLSQLHLTNYTSSFATKIDDNYKQVAIDSFGSLFYLLPFAILITTYVIVFELFVEKLISKV